MSPPIGDSFIFLNYASLTGGFSRIQNEVFNNGAERWVVNYEATYAVLTATKNVPDQGSTFLLLTVGLARSGDVSATVAGGSPIRPRGLAQVHPLARIHDDAHDAQGCPSIDIAPFVTL